MRRMSRGGQVSMECWLSSIDLIAIERRLTSCSISMTGETVTGEIYTYGDGKFEPSCHGVGTLARLVDEAVFNVQGFGSQVLGKLGSLDPVLVKHSQHVERSNIHELGSGTKKNTYFEGAGRRHG